MKPQQGKLFKFMRDVIMGLAPFPSEERVGLYETETNMTENMSESQSKQRMYADAVRTTNVIRTEGVRNKRGKIG